jgi:hypothetical protein
MITKKSIVFVLALLSFVCSNAQEVIVDVPKAVMEGETFTLTYTVNGQEVDDMIFESIGKLELVGGPNRSSSLSIVNGKRSSSTSISYYLMAPRPGSYTIPSAVFVIKGKKVETSSVTIQVSKSQSSTDASAVDKTILIKTEITPSKQIYLGQQALLSYDIYFRQGINLGNDMERPNLTPFFYRNLNTNNVNNTKSLNGVVYNTATIEKGALYAQKVGTFNIGILKKSIGIEAGTQQDSDFGFFSRKIYKPAVAESDMVSIEVLPLPENAPENFINAVGKYTAEAFVEKTQNGYDLILKIVGNGDERSLIVPKLKGNADIEIYNGTKIESTEDAPENFIIHTTYFRYPLVFKKEGNVSFDCQFSYFDTEKKAYESIVLPLNQNVTHGQNFSPDVASNQTVTKSRIPAWIAGLFGALISGILAILGLLWYSKKNKIGKDKDDPSVTKDKLLTNIHTLRHAHDPFAEAKSSIMKRMQSQYGIQPKDLNRSYINQFLIEKGNTEQAKIIDDILELCEQAVYGGKNTESDRELLIETMKKI